MECAREEQLAWFRQLGRVAGRAVGVVKPRGDNTSLLRSSTPATRTPWRAFELADVMEQGLAVELATGFVTPPQDEGQRRCMTVTRSEDHQEFILTDEDDPLSQPLLMAQFSEQGQDVYIYVPTGRDPPTVVGPAFTLSHASGDQFTLTSERCECCEYLPPAHASCAKAGKRVLAHIRHSRESIGLGRAMCMAVDLPVIEPDGTPAIWCARNGGAQSRNKLRLESRRPRWSKRHNALTLDFRRRCAYTSAKNFQLQLPRGSKNPDEDGDVELLFGKTGNSTFVLDYRHPLGMVQAFAIALSTCGWE